MKIFEVVDEIPDEIGSYCLIFHLKNSINVLIGKLGSFFFTSGYYYYFGSAIGSGGLLARVNRHISMKKKKFWHVDYLRPHMIFIAAFFTMQTNQECSWFQKIEKNSYFDVPVKGFGASDCLSSCKAHLLHSNFMIDLNEFSEYLKLSDPNFGQLFLFPQENLESTVKSRGKI
ncbi:MAG: GIY-YIG nuclease family protein [Anaerolineaceae bacterium]|nr:GIY-YIG nuclease family protein [Anaerolineaceae bacterium]